MLKRIFAPKMALVFLALAVLGVIFYGPAAQYPFVHDDVVFIQANPDIGRWDNIADVFFHPGVNWGAGAIATPYYRPVLEVFYRLEYKIFGMAPSGFHAFNIGLHVVNSWLVWAVLTIGFACSAGVGLFLACIFLLHPVQTQAVACVSGISNLAVTFFCLLSFLCYLMIRRSGMDLVWLYLSGAAFLVALFTKEAAVVLPLIVAGHEWSFGAGVRRKAPVLTLAVLAVLYLAWRQVLFPGFSAQVFDSQGEFRLRLLAIPAALLNYVTLIVWPVNLHYYRSLDILAPKLSPALFLFGFGLLTAAGLMKVKEDVRRQVLFGLGWFLICLLPVLNIAPLINEYSFVQAAEHFVYLPLVGILVAVAALSPGLALGLSRQVRMGAAIGLVLACGMLTAQQLPFWRCEVVLFERAAAFEPRAGRVRLLLARSYADARRYDDALREYSASLQIMTEYVKKAGHSGAGAVYAQFVKTIYFDRGQVLLFKGDLDGSTREYLCSLAVKSKDYGGFNSRQQDSRTFNNLALNMIRSGDVVQAGKYFKQAVVFDGNNAEALSNLGVYSFQKKDTEMARFWFERALKVRPGFGSAWEYLKELDRSPAAPRSFQKG